MYLMQNAKVFGKPTVLFDTLEEVLNAIDLYSFDAGGRPVEVQTIHEILFIDKWPSGVEIDDNSRTAKNLRKQLAAE